jgi:hypothetical protein
MSYSLKTVTEPSVMTFATVVSLTVADLEASTSKLNLNKVSSRAITSLLAVFILSKSPLIAA